MLHNRFFIWLVTFGLFSSLLATPLIIHVARGLDVIVNYSKRFSISSTVEQGNSGSFASGISADGRFVVFSSAATNLVSGDTNGKNDIFVYDQETVQTTRISISSSGEQGNSDSYAYSISANGRFVAFISDATNLVSGDTNGARDGFVYDRQTSQTTRVSISSTGEQGNSGSFGYPSISADGRFVAFSSSATNLVTGDTNDKSDIFVHDRQTAQTIRVSISSTGEQGNNGSSASIDETAPIISADGRFVVFSSGATNLVSGDTNGIGDIFVHDRQTSQTTRASISSSGGQSNNWATDPIISADGRFVVFGSDATNLVSDDTNGKSDIFVHDRQTAQTIRVSISSTGEQANSYSFSYSISADGRFVVFGSDATNLVSDDTNGTRDAFVYDQQSAQTTRVSISSTGEQSNKYSRDPIISADGRFVAFSSEATNLVSGDTNGVIDAFVHDRQTAQTTRVSISSGNLTYSISGRVTDENGADLDGTIEYSGGASPEIRTVQFNGGIYTISNLSPGTYTITPAVTGKTFSPPSMQVTVPESKRDVNFSAKPQQSVVILIPGVTGSTLLRTSDGGLLWPTFFDKPKMDMSLKPGLSQGVYADDAVRSVGGFFSVFKPFLEKMKDSFQYKEYRIEDTEYLTGRNPNKRRLDGCDTAQKDANLFIFAWDWRFGSANSVAPQISMSPSNVELLYEFVQCILKIHEGKEVQINIVAHSMGGNLTTQYLLTHPTDNYIKRVITVGTPYLGAPAAIAALLNGDFAPNISPDTTKTLLEYFPGGHQLLPNKQYFALADRAPFITYQQLNLGDTGFFAPVRYENFQQALQTHYRSPAEGETYRTSVNFVANNEEVFRNPASTDWTENTFGVEFHILYAEGWQAATIGQVKEDILPFEDVGGTIQKTAQYEYQMVAGDETVPVVSASRIGKGLDLNGGAHLYRFKFQRNEDVPHAQLFINKRIQDCIFYLIGNTTPPCTNEKLLVSASNVQEVVLARYIDLWGVTSVRITDGISITDELITSTLSLEVMFPEVKLYYLGNNAVSIIMPEDSSYTVKFTSDDYLQIEVEVGNGTVADHLFRYTDVPVGFGQYSEILSTQKKPIALLVDMNNDTIPDTSVEPSSDLSGEHAKDEIPPAVLVSLNTDEKTVSITATDNLSGVSRIFYSTDGTRFMYYTQPFSVGVGKTTIYAQAEDKVGNLSGVFSQEVVVTEPTPQSTYIFLPLVNR